MMSRAAAHHDASLPVAYQLYLPKEWAKDPGVPKNIKFKTKPQIALEQPR
jgi:SRSO17 transposase